MFHGWDTFYLLVGSAAGALIGVMFVVATLTAGLPLSTASRGAQVYITPIVFHFATVMLVSAISAVPEMPAAGVAVVLALCATTGLVYSVVTTIRMFAFREGYTPDWSDKCFYGFLPAVIYLGLAGAAVAVWLAPRSATYAVGVTMLVLLLLGIRNAWDLATALVKRSRDRAN